MLKTKHSIWHSGSPGSELDMILPTWYEVLNIAVKYDVMSSLLELHLCGYCESSREEDSQSRQGDIAYYSWRKKNAIKRKINQKQSQLPWMKFYRWRWAFGLTITIDVRENNYLGDFGIQHICNIQLSETEEKNGLTHKVWSKMTWENWFSH